MQSMVGWLSLFLSVCFLNGAESTNGPSVNALSLKIKAEKNRIIPFEPVFLSVTISNMAATPISLPGRWRSSFRFQVRDSGVGEWRDIREWWKPSLSQPPLPAVSLNANEVQTVRIMLYTFNPQYEQLFVPGHAYLVRACLDNENVSSQAELTALDVPSNDGLSI